MNPASHRGPHHKKSSVLAGFLTRLLAWAAIVALLVDVAAGADYSDLRGPYCARSGRGRDCCPDRRDDCSVPILGTLCYCDQFCNRTRNEDCCPDYWQHCLGMEPPEPLIRGCQYEGRELLVGQSIRINCNRCTCSAPSGAAFSPTERPEIMCERDSCLVEPEVIRAVNARNAAGALPWRASNFTTFWGKRLDEGLTQRLGTLQPQRAVRRMRPIKRGHAHESQTAALARLPRSFDARTRWPGRVSRVADQGWCGASWAVSTAQVASDRFALMSSGEEDARLAPMHLLACNTRGQRACNGGHLDRAWFFLRKYGLVDEECYPYTADNGEVGSCRLPLRTTLQAAGCRARQRIGSSPRTSLYHTGPPYRLGSETDIMDEIMASGPVQATMKVYHDFFMYKSGIYEQSALGAAERTGYHSVRILGWGEEYTRRGTIKYWLVANSWGEQWGENGYFRIRRGTNECEIEDFVLASWADTVMPPVEKMKHHNGNRHSNAI